MASQVQATDELNAPSLAAVEHLGGADAEELELAKQERPAGDIVIRGEYQAFKVKPKADEVSDSNFPPTLYAAVQLFVMAGLGPNAKTCCRCVDAFLAISAAGPDGKTSHRIGRPAVCWNCGHVGVPSNAEEMGEGGGGGGVPLRCRGCNSDEQTNEVLVKRPDGKQLPWIEAKEENSQTALAAKAAAAAAVEQATLTGAPPAAAKGRRTKPNEACPCGSGKKFKKCMCGAQ